MKNYALKSLAILSFLFFLLPLKPTFAGSVSVPSAAVAGNSQKLVKHRLDNEAPLRQVVFLDDRWTIRNPSNGETRGELRLPFSFHVENEFLLETSFEVNFEPGEEVRLMLGMLNGAFSIRLNDSTIARERRRYMPFEMPLPQEMLKNGSNTLQIVFSDGLEGAADNPQSSLINLPRINSGIFTGAYLSIAPRYRIVELLAGTDSDSILMSTGSMKLNRPLPDSLGYRVSFKLLAANGSIFRQTDEATADRDVFQLPSWNLSALSVWSPDSPATYQIEARLMNTEGDVDILRIPFAIRDSRFRERLAQKELQLRGINYVYQTPDGASWFDEELVKRDLVDIKARGYNAVRVIFHTMPEAFYRICDEIGLYCLQDLPVVFSGISSESRSIPRDWNLNYNRAVKLAGRYSSLAAIGLAYNLNAQSGLQWNRLLQFSGRLAENPVLSYISSYNLPPEKRNEFDFTLMEIVDRNNVEESLALVSAQASRSKTGNIMPSGFTRPLTYRIDLEFLVVDSLQISELERELRDSAGAFGYPGYFVRTYSDFYSWSPLSQNGILPKDRSVESGTETYFRNAVGLVDLSRSDKLKNNNSNFRLEGLAARGMISEGKSVHSFLYIFVGILNLFFFLVLYKRFKIFRQNVHYSISKPHGFFVNLQERISVPYKQTFFLLVVIALNAALVYSSFTFYYRYDLRLDYLLSFFVKSPDLKAGLLELIWNQPQFLIFGTIAIAFIFILLAIPIKLLALFSSSRVPFSQAIAASVWSAAPFVLLLPLGIFMYNILIAVKSYWILLGVLLYFHAWYYLRWVNGARVLTDKLYSRVFLIFTFLGIALIAGIGYFYYSSGNFLEHLNLLENLSELYK